MRLGRAAQKLVAALSSGSYGLAFSRYLFERDPVRGAVFGEWPGALSLAGLGAGLGVLLALRLRRVSAGAFLALLLPLIWLFAPDVNPLRSVTLLLGAPVLLGLLILSTAERENSAGLGVSAFRVLRSWGLGIVLFCLYLRTLAPAVGEADTFEFQVGIARLGIAHGSGYPLLMLIGKAFSLLPVGGTLAFRANLTSAFFGALAAVGVERVARRLGVHPLTALLVGLAFGVSPTLWSRAVEVEAYTLNAAFVVGILYLLTLLVDGSRLRVPYAVYLLAFTMGLSLTNHLTTLVLAPACLVALLIARQPNPERHRAPSWDASPIRFYALLIGFLLLGLSVYLYLPIRWPAVNHGELLSWRQFVNLLSGGEAKGALQWALPFTDTSRYSIVWRKVAGEYGWAGLGLAALGMIALAARPHPPPAGASPDDQVHRQEKGSHKLAALILALAYSGYAYFALAFNVPDPDFSAILIPMHLITAILMGMGAKTLLDLTGRLWATSHWNVVPSAALQESSRISRFSRLGFCLLHCAMCIVPLRSIWLTLPRVDQSRDWEKYRLGLDIFQHLPPQAAAILADSEKIAPLYYLQVAEGLRPDLDIIVLPDEASYRTVLDERVAAGQTVYLGRYLPGLGSAYSLRSRGPLVEVSPEPFTSEAYATDSWVHVPLSAALASNIRLLGYQAIPEAIYVGDNLPLTLYWGAETMVNDNYLVHLRLINGDRQMAWQSAGRVPVGSLYPINAWRPGEVISDYHSIPIGSDLAPGVYALEAGLFPPFQVSETGWVGVAPVKVAPYTRISPGCTVEISSTRLPCAPRREPASPSHPLRARFGEDWLLGYDSPESAPPGSRQTLTLYWLRTEAATRVTAFGETRSLAAWSPGSIVPLHYELSMPAEGDRFEWRIETGEPARCGWLSPVTSACAPPSIRLAGAAIAEGAINFDHQLVLTRATLDTSAAARGGQVEVTLHWQGLKTMAENYTVFVHLLGPDGLVHGQVDAWPVAGTLATSQWTPGQPIEDHYRVPLDPDAPPGEYSVEVGLYLLATLERLAVLNAEGAPVDDKVLIHGLTVH